MNPSGQSLISESLHEN